MRLDRRARQWHAQCRPVPSVPVAEFLSEAWFRALDEAARRAPAVRDGDLVFEARVGGGPGGDVTFHLEVTSAGARLVRGTASAPTVIIETDRETAAALHRGETNAQRALAAGRLEVHGDLAALARRSDVLAAMGDVFGPVRARTAAEAPSGSLPG